MWLFIYAFFLGI